MKTIFTKTIGLVLLLILPGLTILSFLSVRATDAAQQKQAQNEFYAVLVDTVSKKPVQSARIILAPKKEGKSECLIDTSLTGISNERGEIRIPNIVQGEYVVFYNLSGAIKPGLQGKVVNYDTEGWHGLQEGPANFWAIRRSLGQLMAPKGAEIATFNGKIVLNGYIYSVDFDLAMFSFEGKLRKINVPIPGSSPVQIEINLEIGK